MTFYQAVRKKFWLAARILHVFEFYAREYEKGLSAEERKRFREFFGE